MPHSQDISQIISVYNSKVKPFFVKTKGSNGIFDPPMELEVDQGWKNDEILQILGETLNQIHKSDFGSVQHLLFPPVITLIQDYEIKYKIMGIGFLRIVIGKAQDLGKTGLTELFLKDLNSCLTYHSNPELVQVSLDLMLDIIEIYCSTDELEKAINDGIVRGLVYSLGVNDQVQNIFLKAFYRIIPAMGILSIQFTKTFLVNIADVLMVSATLDTIRIALSVLNIVMEYCWARIPEYRGIILSSIAESWRISLDREQNLAAYHKSLVLLRECCGESILRDDVKLLQSMEFYKKLLAPLVM